MMARILIAVGALGLLAACGDESAEPDLDPAPEPTTSPVSILRPDVEQPPKLEVLSPLEARIGFPDGGTELSEEALAQLATVRESPQVAEGGPIILRAHSDAGGSDAVNIRASQARAEAVRDWLVEMGVDEGRITVIAFGEQNPVEPNALPDGTPNEPGRAANRRVDVTVDLAEPKAVPEADSDKGAEPGS